MCHTSIILLRESGETQYSINNVSTYLRHSDVITLTASTESFVSSSTCLLTAACVLLWLVVVVQQTSHADDTASCRLPPGSFGWPLIGETLAFVLDGRKYFRTRRREHGPIFSTHLLGRHTIVVVGSSGVKAVLSARESTLAAATPGCFARLFGPSALCTSSGSVHRRLRRQVAQMFDGAGLSRMALDIQEAVRAEVGQWVRHAGESSSVLCVPRCRRLALQTVSAAVLGLRLSETDVDLLAELFSEFSDAAFSLPVNFPGFAYRKGLMAREKALTMLRRLQTGSDVIDPTSSDADSLTLELLYGGDATTTSAMCTAIIELSQHHHVIQRVRDELRQAGISNDVISGDVNISYDVLRKLKYTSAVVREVLRVQPPVAGGFRQTVETFSVGSYEIPTGWGVLYAITDTHESSFSDFLTFDPSRWLRPQPEVDDVTGSGNESSSTLSRYSYVPFGGGSQRYCVGRQLATLTLTIFVIELARAADHWTLVNGRPQIRSAPIPMPSDDLPVVFRCRDERV